MQPDERAQQRSRNDALREQIDSMLAALDRQQQHMAEATERLAHSVTEAWSSDGLVRVVVNAAGIPTEVHLDPDAFKRSRPERLGASMVEAAQAAARQAAESTRATVAPVQEIADGMPDLSALVPGAPSLRALLHPRLPEPASDAAASPAPSAGTVDEDDDVWGGSILRESR